MTAARTIAGDALLPILLPAPHGAARKEHAMKGYVARKGNRWYAVIYEGIDPMTGSERRSWHAAGT